MNNILTYKGYTAKIEIDLEKRILVGTVIDLRDVIVFQSETVKGIVPAFHNAVDEYLAFCKKKKRTAEKPFSGKILFRTTPENHRRISAAAHLASKSINSWMESTLIAAAEAQLEAQKLTQLPVQPLRFETLPGVMPFPASTPPSSLYSNKLDDFFASSRPSPWAYKAYSKYNQRIAGILVKWRNDQSKESIYKGEEDFRDFVKTTFEDEGDLKDFITRIQQIYFT